MNAKQMITKIRSHTGPIEMPVLTHTDVTHIVVQKADLIRELEHMGTNPWYVVSIIRCLINGSSRDLMRLDVKC